VRLTVGRGTNRYTLGFGGSVALSADGTTALVGAAGVRSERGTAWVLTGGWTLRGIRLMPVDETGVGDGRGSRFGLSVALSADGDTALNADVTQRLLEQFLSPRFPRGGRCRRV
jgi:hypothetical protein